MSERHGEQGQGEGFFDKVKDFFTGDDRDRTDAAEGEAEFRNIEEPTTEETWEDDVDAVDDAPDVDDSRGGMHDDDSRGGMHDDATPTAAGTYGGSTTDSRDPSERGEESAADDATAGAWERDPADGPGGESRGDSPDDTADHSASTSADRGDAEQGDDGLGSHDAVGAAEAERDPDDVARAESRGTAEGSGSAVDDDGWDGSGEPPEVEVRESEAVQRHIEETGGAEGYEGRHGGGVDDDVPADDGSGHQGGPVTPDNPDDEVDTATERAAHGEPVRAERDGSDVDSDPASAAGNDAEGDADRAAEQGDLAEDEDARREREEAFAREHDPANHDVAAGEEFRQPGDWAAGEDGPQVQEADGTVHEAGSSEEASAGDGGGHGPRESSLDEVRDGGHGWGSAAPIGPDVMPIGHPVKAWYDTGSFVCEGDQGYDGAEPDVWFTDAETAQRAGFRHGLGE